jgi:hypothetical protein
MKIFNFDFVVCWAIVGTERALEFIHRFDDNVSATGWVALQGMEWVETAPGITVSTREGEQFGGTTTEIIEDGVLKYRYDTVNEYAAELLSQVFGEAITTPIPLWELVVYRKGVPEFDPEVELAYAWTGKDALAKVLGRLGAGWAGYKHQVVDWAHAV